MRFALMTEPQQGLSYDEFLAAARAAEAAGLEAIFRADHYASFPGPSDNPTTDAWTTLAGLARDTSTIHFGTLVSPVAYRQPGNLAKVVATVDEMSGGRVEVGIGAGWNAGEHAAHGLPFPSLRERYDMLEEALTVIHGLWTEPDGWGFAGRYWQVRDALFRPRPTASGRRHPNLILGGDGGPRQARLVAAFADEYSGNTSVADLGASYQRVRAACHAIGRDPDDVVRGVMIGVLVADTAADLEQRIHDQIAMFGEGGAEDAEAWLAPRRRRWIIGTPEQAWERVRSLESLGAQRIMLQDFLPRDLDMIALLGRIAAG
jgi:F420-dependent oxidoreductase-like protein